ncbi:MAG TPA: AAA family ATPase [Tepidisphaeraceae bacterium]|nr:AAA family ATPase [Tepidisphaeraceae bacterium]
MYAQLTAQVVDADPANREEMASFLVAQGVDVSGRLASVDQLEPALAGGPAAARLAVVTLDPNPRETLAKVGHLVRRFPETQFFVLSTTVDPKLLMDAIRQGVREFIPLPVDEEQFRAAVDRVNTANADGGRSHLITIIPAAGGCGATTVACNVAAALAKKGKTLLMDLDLVRGAVATSFDLRPRYTIADLMHSADKLDRQLVENALVTHAASGVHVLARPEQPEEGHRVTPAGLNRLLRVVGGLFDYIVVDGLMSVDPLYATAMKAADVNVMVMELTVPNAHNVERFTHVLRRLGVEQDRIRVVVNRAVKKADVDPADVEKLLKTKLAWSLPNDFRNAVQSINVGEPVVLRAPRAELSASLVGLAAALNGRA